MKLYIELSFFDAMLNLPKSAQKRSREFLKKFQENPKSSGIHLEKISQWPQPELRSARVDQSYRAVVYRASEGEVFRLLWVGNHDDAYDWPKNKHFAWNDQVQSFQVFEMQEEIPVEQRESTPKVSAPEDLPPLFGDLTDSQLLQLGTPSIALPWMRKIRQVETFWELEKALPKDAFEYLFYYVEGEPFEALIQEIEAGKVSAIESETAVEDSPNAQRNSRLVVDDADLEEILTAGKEKWQLFLHPSQYQLAYRTFKGPMKLTGAAGTGKTVVALHRVKYLSERLDLSPEQPILLTTYTKRLTESLQRQVQTLGVEKARVTVENIHRLAHEVALKLGIVEESILFLDFTQDDKEVELWSEVLDFEYSDFDATQLREEYHEVVLDQDVQSEAEYLQASRLGRTFRVSRKQRKHLWRLFERFVELREKYGFAHFGEVTNRTIRHLDAHPHLRPFSHVICDEIQDLSNLELRFLRALVAEGPDDLFLVGDPLQKIYKRKLNFSAAGIHVRGRRSRRLKLNYRTTEEIKRAAMATIHSVPISDLDDGEEQKRGYLSLMHGPNPRYQLFSSPEEEQAAILQKLRQWKAEQGYAWADMVVACHKRSQLKVIQKLLHEARIPYFHLLTQQGDQHGVRLSTLHSLKGLEFRAVLLAKIDQATLPSRPHDFSHWSKAAQHYHDQRERSLLYVAMSRAILELYLTGCGKRCELVEV